MAVLNHIAGDGKMVFQRGFVQLSMLAWVAIASGTMILVLMGTVYIQTVRLTASKAEYAEFKGGVEAIGKAAEQAAKDKTLRDKLAKGTADEENKRTTDALRATVKRLRDERAGGGIVPAAPSGTGSPDRASFDRAELERALRSLDTGIQGIVDEGSKAVTDLNTSKRWWHEVAK